MRRTAEVMLVDDGIVPANATRGGWGLPKDQPLPQLYGAAVVVWSRHASSSTPAATSDPDDSVAAVATGVAGGRPRGAADELRQRTGTGWRGGL